MPSLVSLVHVFVQLHTIRGLFTIDFELEISFVPFVIFVPSW